MTANINTTEPSDHDDCAEGYEHYVLTIPRSLRDQAQDLIVREMGDLTDRILEMDVDPDDVHFHGASGGCFLVDCSPVRHHNAEDVAS